MIKTIKAKVGLFFGISLSFFVFFIVFNALPSVSISLHLPFGWSTPDYPRQCLQLENKTFNGSKYIIEPGFPFRYERSIDGSLDTITSSKHCPSRTVISSNRVGAVLNWLILAATIILVSTTATYGVIKFKYADFLANGPKK